MGAASHVSEEHMVVGRLVGHVCDVSGKIGMSCAALAGPVAACGLPDEPLWKRAGGPGKAGRKRHL